MQSKYYYQYWWKISSKLKMYVVRMRIVIGILKKKTYLLYNFFGTITTNA